MKLIHEAGGLAIPPHPYDRFRAGIREPILETLEIDAIEVFNAATTLKRFNRHAFDYAQERGLPMTAASDAHDSAALGTAYSILEADEFSVKGVLDAIRKGPALRQRYLTPRDALKKTWNNVFPPAPQAQGEGHPGRCRFRRNAELRAKNSELLSSTF